MNTDRDLAVFQTMPKPKHRHRSRISRFELWAWSPVISFQIGLTAGYLAMIYFGVSAFIAEVPAFSETAPDGWSVYWAVALILGGMMASVGSVSRAKLFERVELIGSLLISLTVGSYAAIMLFMAYVLNDVGRASGGAGFVALVVPVLVRMLWLASQSLRK